MLARPAHMRPGARRLARFTALVLAAVMLHAGGLVYLVHTPLHHLHRAPGDARQGTARQWLGPLAHAHHHACPICLWLTHLVSHAPLEGAAVDRHEPGVWQLLPAPQAIHVASQLRLCAPRSPPALPSYTA